MERGPNRAPHIHLFVKVAGFEDVIIHVFPPDYPCLKKGAVFGMRRRKPSAMHDAWQNSVSVCIDRPLCTFCLCYHFGQGRDAMNAQAKMHSVLQRCHGETVVGLDHVTGKSHLMRLRQRGSAKAIFPHVGAVPEGVFLNTSGGLTGVTRRLSSCRRGQIHGLLLPRKRRNARTLQATAVPR